MGTPRPVERSLVAEFGEDADDDEQDGVPSQRSPRIPRTTRNADTPSANKVLAKLGEDMRSTGGWLSKFEPKPKAQAQWPVLGPELTHPVSSADLPGLVYETSTLLRAMGFHCMGRPSRLEQMKWTLKAAGNEVMQWKMKLRTAFGLERITDVPRPRVPRLAESTNSASATAEFPVPVAESAAMAVDPSRIPLPKTPDVKRSREVSRTSGGTPYFGDTDMHTPPRGSTQFDESRGLADAVESDDDMTPGRPKLIHSDRNRSNVLEVRTHASLDKIAVFEGKRNRSEDSLQWLKRFIYEMKGTRMPNDSWCEPFSLSLGKAAKSWFRQLPKKTQLEWGLLSSAFLDYYCSQYAQTAQTRYFSARRKESEHICDFLLKLNGYARAAKIQYEAGGPQAASHVEHFLLHCGDDAVMDQLYPRRLSDIQRVEKIINQKLLGDKRKKQRDRTAADRVRESRRDDGNRRSESKRSDGYRERRRDDQRDRREDRRGRRSEDRERRVTLADASVEDLRTALDERRASHETNFYDSFSEGSDKDAAAESSSDSGSDYIDAGAAAEPKRPPYRGGSSGAHQNSAPRSPGRSESRGYPPRRDESGERRRYGPCGACGADGHDAHFCRRRCKFCKQVHDAGSCELFQRFEKLTKFVKSSVDKSLVPADLQDLYSPGDLN
ncbi:hypothetical protein PF004_g29986 [Phytophthora fragariae]|uniref:Retrotransposon gag domain-containing protein n=2 Tax=Phytophthora fragariae TaxID=53985 RepID=A0A6G0MD95_9STRA|nr:hypothetical protein PF004_g29986 [Phytophthora fragariae]